MKSKQLERLVDRRTDIESYRYDSRDGSHWIDLATGWINPYSGTHAIAAETVSECLDQLRGIEVCEAECCVPPVYGENRWKLTPPSKMTQVWEFEKLADPPATIKVTLLRQFGRFSNYLSIHFNGVQSKHVETSQTKLSLKDAQAEAREWLEDQKRKEL